MKTYHLKQGWTKKPLDNLVVECNLKKSSDFLNAMFNITEPSVRAENSGFNKPVWEDSCIEFFLTMDFHNYYNFEINCIGSVLGQFGHDRYNRTFLEEKTLDLIKVESSLGKNLFGIINSVSKYTIEVKLPKEVFVFDKQKEFILYGNIYKCADKSPSPHYMYLNEIKTEKPDFHRPEFFDWI